MSEDANCPACGYIGKGVDFAYHGCLSVLRQRIAALEADAIKRVSELERGIAERDETIRQLRAQLDEYERAPTVAWLSIDCIGERYLLFSRPKDNDELHELIARPTRKDGE